MSQTCIVRLPPKEKDWKFAFQFRFHRDLPHELTLKYGCEMRGCAVPVSDPDPQVYRLPVAPGGFALERVRENLGTYALECNGFLQRSAFDAMPSSCLFQVPRRQWARAKAVCRVDPSAPASAVPVITARLTHYWWNGGRSLAMCEKTVDLRKDTASFVKKGDVYEVTFDFDIGSLQGLVHMRDGLVGRTAVAVGRYGLTLDLMEMKSGSPKVRIGSVEAW